MLSLHVPTLEELWYRQKLMEDPATMDYNRGYDLPFEGYDRETGCIPFPKEAWADWYAWFIGQEPRRFYAYIVRQSDGQFVGEVNLHQNGDDPWYEMGIVLEGQYRGRGYAKPALELLLRQAFVELEADAVHNDFEATRAAALQIHLEAGFRIYGRKDGGIQLSITRREYFATRATRNWTHWLGKLLTGGSSSNPS